MKLLGHMRVKGFPPPIRSRVRAQAECSEARLVAPGADPAVPTEDPRVRPGAGRCDAPVLPIRRIDLDCNRKPGVITEKKTPGPAKYFITLQRSGLGRCAAMPLRCGRRGSGRMLGWPTIADDADERTERTNKPRRRPPSARVSRFMRVRTRGHWQDRLPFTIAREMQRRAEAGR